MGILEKSGTIFDRLNDTMIIILSGLVIFDFLAILYEVISRYVFNSPTTWVIELTEYSLLYIAFLGAAHVQRRGGHVTVDIYATLGPTTVRIIDIIVSLLCGAMSLFLLWYGLTLFLNVFRSGVHNADTMLNIPQYPILIVIPIGGALLFIQFVRRAFYHIQRTGNRGREKKMVDGKTERGG